jgi:hypothetical protein
VRQWRWRRYRWGTHAACGSRRPDADAGTDQRGEPPPSDDVPIAQQSIGPAGTADLQFLFFSPLHVTRGIAHLSFDQMRFAPTGGSESPEQIAPGPWTFDLPLG